MSSDAYRLASLIVDAASSWKSPQPKVAQGGGPAPYGYRWHNKGLIEHEAEALMLARVRAWRADGKTLLEIIELCRAQGIRTRRGRAPGESTVSGWCRGVHVPGPRTRVAHGPKPEMIEPSIVAFIRDRLLDGLTWIEVKARVRAHGYRSGAGRVLDVRQLKRVIERSEEKRNG